MVKGSPQKRIRLSHSGVSDPAGAFKLDHLQSVILILLEKNFNLFAKPPIIAVESPEVCFEKCSVQGSEFDAYPGQT